MPQKLKRACNQPGCPALTHDRYCPLHKKQKQQRYQQERGTAASRGYTYQWQKYRLRFLKKNPLCVHCENKGVLTPSEHVDHIIAVTGPNDPLFWKESNHQALCHSCHSRKTVLEDGGFGR
ncbi:HNH endonuclease [Paenibacillus sp. Pae108]|uniref:HNH endonuclease n=1 Tax=Paenibacillus sp. Pae108 TaxID=2926019 RepID=UPI002117D307|nr:HNH endonuclease signature motif containing protein [Paenibacillus sp. Pae108]